MFPAFGRIMRGLAGAFQNTGDLGKPRRDTRASSDRMQPEEGRDIPERWSLSWIFFLIIVFAFALFVNLLMLVPDTDVGDPDEESSEYESSEEG